MPGYRRTRKYAKKTYRRKKVYRRKRMMGRKKADLGHLEKITKRFPVTIDAGGGYAQFDINWLATGASGQ